ncbi:MAG: MBL fold metallo-hydrolase [Subdoligranulum sp.]|nr:MBL fold metallo-hydrolase [Subdoligranulum sp.]
MKTYHIPAAPPLRTNTFLLIGENGKAAAIDPNADAAEYLRLLEEYGAQLTHILLTHGHYDHVGAVEALREKTGAGVWLNPQDTAGDRLFPFTTPDHAYIDGETITVDTDLAFQVIATPGHSAGSVCLLCGGLLFSGDTLFACDIGRTDLAGGDMDAMRQSLAKLCKAVTQDVKVLPGHEEFSTMDYEKEHNPYLK